MKISTYLIVAAATLATSLSACKNNSDTSANNRTSFLDKAGMDTTILPGNDFFDYANGTWMKATEIPGDESGWGSFYTLYNDNLQKLKVILEAAGNGASAGSIEQKVGDFYKSGMDTNAIERLAAQPVKPLLDKIAAVKDVTALVQLIAANNAAGISTLMGFSVEADEKNSSEHLAVFRQSGLSLPQKDYYFKSDSATLAARNAILKYATRLFELAGDDATTAATKAASVLAVETVLAKSHKLPVELRDPQQNYHKMAVATLQQQHPNLNWLAFFDAMQVKPDSVDIAQPAYFEQLNQSLTSLPLDQWKAKLAFDYLNNNAGLLSKAFREASFEFGKTFSGRAKDSDRWKKMIRSTDSHLGELLGQLYVKKHFTETAKKRMDELVNNLQTAFEKRINALDWMSDSTKQKAKDKLHTFLKKIGYPTQWKNYDDVQISANDYFGNVMNTQKHDQHEMVAKIGKKVDRNEWGLTTPTVNAYYNATNNEIVFPAGILQFPFFDEKADDAIIYGGIGMVIGHEMTHGFDDEGSQYDAVGNLSNWWTPTDAAQFKSRTTAVAGLYNQFTILDSLHVNGDLTLGENLADFGGIAIAFDAFKLTNQGQGNEKIDGFTPDQRFFLSFAQIWRLKNREATMRVRITTDPHSPEKYRVNGPLMNFEPFYKAFNVVPGNQMYREPANRIKVW